MEDCTILAILLLQLVRFREDLQVQLVSRFEINFILYAISEYKCATYNCLQLSLTIINLYPTQFPCDVNIIFVV